MTKYISLGEVISSANVERCGNRKYPVLSMTMHNGIVLQNDRFKKSLASLDQSNYKVVKRGQLVVGFPIDEGVLYVQKAVSEGIMSPAYNVWNINSDIVDAEYLEMCLHSPQAMQFYKSHLRGTTARRRSIPTETLLSLKIYIPSFDVQKRIVSNIDKIDSLISKRRQQLASLDLLVKARFAEMFGDPVSNPKSYPVYQLSKYIEFLTSGSRGWAQYCTDNGTEWFITIKNVKDCHILVDNMQPIDAPNNAEAKRTKVQEGDLLISITADLGRTGVVTKEIAEHGAYINQHLTCIRLNTEVVNPLYVAHFMESSAGKEQFKSKNQSAVKAGLNFNSINSLRITVPPMKIQNEFVNFVSRVNKAKLAAQKSLQELETLKKSLMQQYFG